MSEENDLNEHEMRKRELQLQFDLSKHDIRQHELRFLLKIAPYLTLALALMCGTCVATWDPKEIDEERARAEGYDKGRVDALKQRCLGPSK